MTEKARAYVRDAVLVDIENYEATCIGVIATGPDPKFIRDVCGIPEGEWLPLVRDVFAQMLEERQIEQFYLATAHWYRRANALDQIVMALDED